MNSGSHSHAEQSVSAPVSAIGSLLGTSAAMQEVFRLIERVGPTEASVFLTGESGSGKELVARSIHACSGRRDGPFIAINCGAIPAGLIEGELFGAEGTHAGAFERAHGGTLLLDEIAEMPLDMQARLLPVLESHTFYRVGANTERQSDVRVIAATNRCPLGAVQSGHLREDLLYRLAVFPIELPPLRSRGDDVELLAGHFLAELNARATTHKRLSAHARMTLREHSWPGNVRELKNCIERAFILADALLELEPLIQSNGQHEQAVGHGLHSSNGQANGNGQLNGNGHQGGNAQQGGNGSAVPAAMAQYDRDLGRLDIRVGSRIYDMERSLIEATLDYFKGNKRRAADALGCSLKTLYNKLNGYSQRQECANS